MTFRWNKKNTPIIVGGFYRSGTSLFRRMLDAHSRIHCPAEIKLFKDIYGDYLDDPLAHGRFFKSMACLSMGPQKLATLFGRLYVDIRKQCLKRLGKKRWADKNPENVLYLKDWQRVLGDRFTFIYIVRNPLDVLCSLEEVGFEKTVPPLLEERVKLYQRYVAAANAFMARYPKRTIVVQYEDLVHQPEKVLKRVCQQLGECFEHGMVMDINAPERVGGLEDPKVKQATSVFTTSCDRWRRELTEEQVTYITHALRPVFDAYGYACDEVASI